MFVKSSVRALSCTGEEFIDIACEQGNGTVGSFDVQSESRWCLQY